MIKKLVSVVPWGFVFLTAGYSMADSHLVAHYEFNAPGDYSNSVAGGVVGQPQGEAGIIWDDERDSDVLSLDGDGDYVSCEDGWMSLVETAITVAAWMRTDSLASYDMVVGLGYAWRLYGGSNGNIRFQCSDTVPSGSMAIGSTDVNDGQWHHVAGTYDGTQYTLYVDGVLDASTDASGSINRGSSYFGTIGAHHKKNDDRDPRRFFEGLIDDVRIYDRALTGGEIRQIFTFKPGSASQPRPADEQMDVARDVVLIWTPAEDAVQHDIYFGIDFNDVNDANRSDTTGIYRGRQNANSYTPAEILEWETTYYWRIDEVNDAHPDSPWKGSVWSFTVGHYLLVDDFEGYTGDDTTGQAIWQNWTDGLDIADNGSQVGYLLPPYAEQTIVHAGLQSMPMLYDNTAGVMNSEARKTLTHLRDWTQEGMTELALWFAGRPPYVGGFMETPPGTYTMTASGADIWGTFDEFHFAFKTLAGPGTIIAQIESLQNPDNWAKAGVMIRETMEPDSKHAMVALTPGNGVWLGWRPKTGNDSFSQKQTDITAPHWVKLDRDISGDFTAYHSTDGSKWLPLGLPQNIQMNTNVYIGLALTSHNVDSICEAQFSNVAITGTVGPQWTNQDIGIASNDPEPIYVTLSNANGTSATVAYGNPAAATFDTWTQWVIPLQGFADQGVNLADVDSIAIGLGAKAGVVTSGGSGMIYFDDIRLYPPAPEPEPQP